MTLSSLITRSVRKPVVARIVMATERKSVMGCRVNDGGKRLPLEGNTESDLRNSLLVADQWRARAILI